MKAPSIVSHGKPDATETKSNDWKLRIFLPLVIMLTLMAGRIFLNLESDRSEFVETEKVAYKTYWQYSQRLDAISKKYQKELASIKKEN
jgi:hypothetical protein